MKKILVTGASRGIGKEVAIRLAQDGFYVIINYLNSHEQAQETLDYIKSQGGDGCLLKFDVGSREESKQVLEQFQEEHGALYGIVSNAGITRDCAFPSMSDDDWDKVIHTNLDAFYNVVKPCVMNMIANRQGGRIIVMSSVSGILGNRGQVNYSASKAGLIGATKALAIELGKRKITVNAVAPGLIDSDMSNDINSFGVDVQKEIIKRIPLQRMGKAQEVASLVAFLCSDSASYITRQVIAIDGGLS